ncbi:MAG TPA: glycosyltransferase family 9 protein [Drouetiella sp.]
MIPKLHKTNKILAVNFGGIGDEVLFLPTLKTMRKAYPKAHITLLLEPRSQSIKQITDLVDDIALFDIKKRPLFLGDLAQLIRLMQDGDYEMILSSGSSKMVSILLFLAGAHWRIGYDSGPLSHLLLTHPRKLNYNQYASDMYHDLASFMEQPENGFTAANAPKSEIDGQRGTIPEITIPSDSMSRMEDFLSNAGTKSGAKLVLLHPGTSRLAVEKGIIKTWEIDDWIALIEKLDANSELQPVLAGGPDDVEIIKEIQSKLPKNSKLVSAVGKTKSLADLAALTKLCDILVCVDSAPMHIAVGARKPVVAMFGPTDEAKLLPKHPHFIAMRSPKNPKPSMDVKGVLLAPEDVYKETVNLAKTL